MDFALRSWMPRPIRKPRKPKTTPEAPMWTLSDAPTSQVPRPAVRALPTATTQKSARLRAVTRKPSTAKGRVLAMRCAKPPWSSGAKR